MVFFCRINLGSRFFFWLLSISNSQMYCSSCHKDGASNRTFCAHCDAELCQACGQGMKCSCCAQSMCRSHLARCLLCHNLCCGFCQMNDDIAVCTNCDFNKKEGWQEDGVTSSGDECDETESAGNWRENCIDLEAYLQPMCSEDTMEGT